MKTDVPIKTLAAKLFAAHFKQFGDGYVVYGKDGGRFVTETERAHIIAGYARSLGCRRILGVLGLSVALAVIFAVIQAVPLLTRALPFATLAAILGPGLWYATAPSRLTRRRPVVAPPLTGRAQLQDADDRNPWWLVGLSLVIGIGLLLRAQDPLTNPSHRTFFLVLGAVGVFGTITRLARKVNTRKRLRSLEK